MNREEAHKRMRLLEEEIERNNQLYYVEAAPVISDYEFDQLINELADLDKRYPDLADPNSRSDRLSVAINKLGGDLLQVKKQRQNPTRELGQELVEFAIVVPLLLIVFIGVFDVGRIFHANVTIANASRAGARYATSFGFSTTGGVITLDLVGIKDAVEFEAANSGVTLNRNLITVNCPGSCAHGGTLEVNVTHNFQFLFNAFLGSGITLSHTTEMLMPY